MPVPTRTGVGHLRLLAAALAFVGVLALALACGSSEGDSWEERWADLGVPEAEFVFLGDFTDEERESIRGELKAAQVVFAEQFGAMTSEFIVYVSTDLDALNERITVDRPDIHPFPTTCGGSATGSALLLVVEDCGDELRGRGGHMAHVYFHLLQWRAGRVEGALRQVWLVEGSAEYARALVNEAQGRVALATRREAALLVWSSLVWSNLGSGTHPRPVSFSSNTPRASTRLGSSPWSGWSNGQARRPSCTSTNWEVTRLPSTRLLACP